MLTCGARLRLIAAVGISSLLLFSVMLTRLGERQNKLTLSWVGIKLGDVKVNRLAS